MIETRIITTEQAEQLKLLLNALGINLEQFLLINNMKELINKTILLKRLFLSYFFKGASKILSPINNSNPPQKNPKKIINQAVIFKLSAKETAGSNKDQNAAAIITPALKPNIVFSILLFTSLKKQTTRAPNAVTPQVNVVANNA